MRPTKLKATLAAADDSYTFLLTQAGYNRVQICTVVVTPADHSVISTAATSDDKIDVFGVDEDGHEYALTDVHGSAGPFSIDDADASKHNRCLVFECHFPKVKVVSKETGTDIVLIVKCRTYSTAQPTASGWRAFTSGSGTSGETVTEY